MSPEQGQCHDVLRVTTRLFDDKGGDSAKPLVNLGEIAEAASLPGPVVENCLRSLKSAGYLDYDAHGDGSLFVVKEITASGRALC